MKLNKVLMLAIIGVAFVSFNETLTHKGPQKVQQADDNMLNVKDNNQWHLFKKYSIDRELVGKHMPQYEFTNDTRTVLKVREGNGNYTIYVKVRELTPDEVETIMMNALQD